MVAYKSTRHAGLSAQPFVPVPAADWGGALHGVFDDYTATGAEAAGSLIYLGRIPPNHRVVGGWVKYDACGAGVTLKIGDTADDDRLLTATSVAAAGLTPFSAPTGMGWKNATNSPVDIYATTAGGTLTAGAVVTLHLTTQGL